MATRINDRIDVRISKENKELIKHAAEISGFKSISDFIVYMTINEAQRMMEDEAQIVKSIEDKILIVETLLNPPAPNQELKSALDQYKDLSTSSSSNDFDGFKRKS